MQILFSVSAQPNLCPLPKKLLLDPLTPISLTMDIKPNTIELMVLLDQRDRPDGYYHQ